MANLRTKNGSQNGIPTRVSTALPPSTTPATELSPPEVTGCSVISTSPVAVPQAQPVLTETPDVVLTADDQAKLAEYKKLCQDQYDRYTSHLWDQRHESQAEADKLVVTLAGVSLGLSMGFIKDVVPLAHSVLLPLLFFSWFGFGTSIISTLVSHYLSLKTVNDHIDQCKAYFFEEKRDAFDGVKKGARSTENCNRVSAIAFVVGLFFVLSFIGINVEKEHNRLSEDKNTHTAKMVEPQPTQRNDGHAPFGGTPPPPPVLPKQPTPAASAAQPSAEPKDTKK